MKKFIVLNISSFHPRQHHLDNIAVIYSAVDTQMGLSLLLLF